MRDRLSILEADDERPGRQQEGGIQRTDVVIVESQRKRCGVDPHRLLGVQQEIIVEKLVERGDG